MKICLIIVVLIIQSINSKSIESNYCSICKFDDDFNPSTGYECFHKNINETICTCPDHRYSMINQPCRICNRQNICGLNSNCSEKFLFSNKTQPKPYFACFCQSDIVVIDDKCPDDSSDNTTTTKVPNNNNSTETTTVNINSNETTSECQCQNHGNSFNLFVKSVWIVLLNLVYFINK